MAGRGPSRQELIRQQRRSGFVGRQGEQDAFKEALRQRPEEAAQFLFHIHGPAGVGKSTLARQLESAAQEAGSVTAYVDETVADVVEVLETLSRQLAQQGAPLKALDKALSTYRQRRHEADAGGAVADPGTAASDEETGGEGRPSPSSAVASRLGLTGLGMIPGVGPFTAALDPNQVALGADRVKAALSARLRSHEDVHLVLSPLQALTPVFLRELGEVARDRPWVVLFFDTYERTGPLLDTWIRDLLVSDRYGDMPANVLVVLSGQSQLDGHCWGDWLDLVTDLPLRTFTEDEARRLLTNKGVTDAGVVETILRLSDRLPVLVSTLAEGRPASVAEVEDPSGTAVERFLKWAPDAAHRAAALACALPRELDEDIYRTLVTDEHGRELFSWLRSMPFVTDRAGRCRYHELVRTAMLRLQRQRSPERWHDQHARLADAFRDRRARIEEGAVRAASPWQNERWRGARLHETYHRLCADPHAALPTALRDLLDAYAHSLTSLRRWADIVAEAGRDSDAAAVRDWGRQLQDVLGEPEHPGLAALALILSRGELDTPGQALAYALRGRQHRRAGLYRKALADYTRAIELNVEGDRAFYGRGLTYRLMGRYEDALPDLSAAVDTDPTDPLNHAERGLTFEFLRRYDEALADYDRAIELDPAFSWALANRGDAYRTLGRYDEALADLDRAIELDPDYTWALVRRGRTHQAAKRYDEAFADFGRAIDNAPHQHWALVHRGRLHRDLTHWDEAFADFDRALLLQPDNAWTLAQRGSAHAFTHRYDQALADCDRALELDPDYAWALRLRSQLHSDLDHWDQALADAERAVTIAPDNMWNLHQRASLRRLTGRHEKALADLDRAVEADPTNAYHRVHRGVTHRLLGAHDAALTDLTRALELEPDDGWAHYELAVVHHARGNPERDAQAARAIALLTPESRDTTSWDVVPTRGNLVLVHCLTADWHEADAWLTDFLAVGPPPGRKRELLLAINSLAQVAPATAEHLSRLGRRLEHAFTAPARATTPQP
ncbi:tetratricopeptide repeat protein [Streptomyces sp. PU-14G]|uniref:tetratricopeptide repeat protein n=1 Tax=Streptomyces sp. PU-14G TaxID=2800808 RepID=UPI0034DE033D